MNDTAYKTFQALHLPGKPLILVNCWDLLSARALNQTKVQAIGTSSYALADTLGYNDGESLPFEVVLQLSAALVKESQVPVTIDAEGGYGEAYCQNILALAKVGVVGINLEDQDFVTPGLVETSVQAAKIQAILATCEAAGYSLFINARTDVFFQYPEPTQAICDLALERAKAYHAAGASSIFLPGLLEEKWIEYCVQHSPIPVTIMLDRQGPSIERLTELGVVRISYGPLAYLETQEKLAQQFTAREGEL